MYNLLLELFASAILKSQEIDEEYNVEKEEKLNKIKKNLDIEEQE